MSVISYQINLPKVPQNTYAFRFSTTFAGAGWAFKFIFMNNRWTCYASIPLLAVREASVYNNSLNWSGFPDYGCLFITSVPNMGVNDINSVTMYILDWRK